MKLLRTIEKKNISLNLIKNQKMKARRRMRVVILMELRRNCHLGIYGEMGYL
jgi:hypothetical protein